MPPNSIPDSTFHKIGSNPQRAVESPVLDCFADVLRGRREIDRGPFPRRAVTTVGNGGPDPVSAFFHGQVRQTDDDHHRLSGPDIDLDFPLRKRQRRKPRPNKSLPAWGGTDLARDLQENRNMEKRQMSNFCGARTGKLNPDEYLKKD
jgi:hypothetical protein